MGSGALETPSSYLHECHPLTPGVKCKYYPLLQGLPRWLSGKEPACRFRRLKRHGLNSCIGKIRWRRKWQPTPVFLPRESYGQRSLAGYSPQGCTKSDATEATQHTHILYYVRHERMSQGLWPRSQCVLSRSVMPDSCGPRDCGPKGSSVHGSFQARISEWVTISYSRASSQPRD